MAAQGRPFLLSHTGFGLAHVRPMKADEQEEKSMTTFEFALLINALARLITAAGQFIRNWRRRR